MLYIFLGYLLVIPLIIFFWHFSHLINSLTNWEYMITTQLIDSPWYALEIFIANILHLILLVNIWQNGNNYINILWLHLFHNPPFIGVVSVRDSICYIYQCYYGIRHFYLVCFYFSCMVDSNNFYQDMLVYFFCSSPNITLILLCSKIQPECCGEVSSIQSQSCLLIQLYLPKLFLPL